MALPIAALVASGCGSGQSAATASPAAASTTVPVTSAPGGAAPVKVTVQEYSVVPASTSTKAGDVTFEVTNKGPEDEHEFVVIKTDLAPDKLPTKATGEVDEEGTGIEVIDELAEMPVGETHELKVNLAAGSYVLICNVFIKDENESHYQNGMRVAFTVN
jgi:uncharacterized cupredoxin-like copper-binding protein